MHRVLMVWSVDVVVFCGYHCGLWFVIAAMVIGVVLVAVAWWPVLWS